MHGWHISTIYSTRRSFIMLRKVLIGTGTILIAAVPVANKDEKKKEDEGKKLRPQELPIYGTVHDSQT